MVSKARGAMRHRLVRAPFFEVTHFEERGKLFLFRRGWTSPPVLLSAGREKPLRRRAMVGLCSAVLEKREGNGPGKLGEKIPSV